MSEFCLQDEISKERSLQITTLMGHLATALEADHPVSFQQLGITENKINMVLAVIRAAPINSGK